MKYILSLLLLLAANYSAIANLGETEEQIEAKYGKPIKDLNFEIKGLTKKEYYKNDSDVTVTFLDGKSVNECYLKWSELTDAEILSLLSLNILGSKWVTTKEGAQDNKTLWTLESGNAFAKNEKHYFFEIMTKEYKRIYDDDIAKQVAAQSQSGAY